MIKSNFIALFFLGSWIMLILLLHGTGHHALLSHSWIRRFTPRYLKLKRNIRATHLLRSVKPSIAEDVGNKAAAHQVQENVDTNITVGKGGFRLHSPYPPAGDQQRAIDELVDHFSAPDLKNRVVLRGATGTGKTYVVANTITRLGKPTLVLCPNKTLAAQLVRELRSYLPENLVELFVSYYNHYRPEAYSPVQDRYTAKSASINEELDALRHRCTRALFERRDVVVVASVSCIYGLGLPVDYLQARIFIPCSTPTADSSISMHYVEESLQRMNYQRSKTIGTEIELLDDLKRGEYYTFVGHQSFDIICFPPYEVYPIKLSWTMKETYDYGDDKAVGSSTNISHVSSNGFLWPSADKQLQLSGFASAKWSECDEWCWTNNDTGGAAGIYIYPARHFVTTGPKLEKACSSISEELNLRIAQLKAMGKVDEAVRLQERVLSDLQMLQETGFCGGMENYSRHFSGRLPGQAPDTLVDYFAASLHHLDGKSVSTVDGQPGEEGDESDWLLVVDESHVTIPQLRAMYAGDQARKRTLVEYGFRLPSALDNRPLKDSEFWAKVQNAIFLSATPGHKELQMSEQSQEPRVVDMVIRPTFVTDPKIHIRTINGQLNDLLTEIKRRIEFGDASLVLTLTKRDAEDLSLWFNDKGVRSAYVHSTLNAIQRADVLKSLQNGTLDCIVGVNLLREGIDLPQVSLVAVLDADKEGFLRCESSLIQIVGRSARNIRGEAIFYADRLTKSMSKCIKETERRRTLQLAYIKNNNVEPKSTMGREIRSIFDIFREEEPSSVTLSARASQTSNEREQFNKERESYMDTADELHIKVPSLEKYQRYYSQREEMISAMDEFTSLLDVNEQSYSDDANSILENSTKSSHFEDLKLQCKSLPDTPGVYFWKDACGETLYIGKAKSLRKRTSSYFSFVNRAAAEVGQRRTMAMLLRARSIDTMSTKDERSALLLEAKLVRANRPRYNVQLKDDSSFPWIIVTRQDDVRGNRAGKVLLSQISLASDFSPRNDATVPGHHDDPSNSGSDSKLYFGPFMQVKHVNRILTFFEELFKLRQRAFEIKMNRLNHEDTSVANDFVLQYERYVDICVMLLEGNLLGAGEQLIADGEYDSAEKVFQLHSRGGLYGSFLTVDGSAAAVDVNCGRGGVSDAIEKSFSDFLIEPTVISYLPSACDLVAVGLHDAEGVVICIVQVIELRSASVHLRHKYETILPVATAESADEEHYGEAMQRVLERHYFVMSGNSSQAILPQLVLTQYSLIDENLLASQLMAASTGRNDNRHTLVRQVSNDLEQKLMSFAIANAETAAQIYDSEAEAASLSTTDLQQLLNLTAKPIRIEGFDVSHTQGVGVTGSNVVYINGTLSKKLSKARNFGSDQGQGNDDYLHMEQLIFGRFHRKSNRSKLPTIPDLIVVDGGKGQLLAAAKGLISAGLFACRSEVQLVSLGGVQKSPLHLITFHRTAHSPGVVLCALAKAHEELFTLTIKSSDHCDAEQAVVASIESDAKCGTKAPEYEQLSNVMPVLIESRADQPGMRFLRAVRDESHRRAVQAHRRRRSLLNGLSTRRLYRPRDVGVVAPSSVAMKNSLGEM